MKKPTWNDFQEATQEEIKKTYKLDSKQLEMSLRDHLYGANTSSRRNEYNHFYSRTSRR